MIIDDISNSTQRQLLRAQAAPQKLCVLTACVTVAGRTYVVSPDGKTVRFEPPLDARKT